MNSMMLLNEAGIVNYFVQNSGEILSLTFEHIQLTVFSVLIAIIIGVPLGILISYVEKLNKPVLALANVMQAIPSLALLGFMIPFLGIGEKPAIVMIVVYSLLPIIKNTATGLGNIDDDMLEAASGIGMSKSQILFKVKLPLALPVIMAGVRISAVSSVGLVTIAAFIGAGGLGYLVYAGIRTVSTAQILAGAIPAALIALVMDSYMGFVEQAVTPISLQEKNDLDKADFNKQNKKKTTAIISMILIVGLVVVLTLKPYFSNNDNEIVVGAKNYAEQEVIAEMMKLVIEEDTDYDVVIKRGLGSTATILDALVEGSLDLSSDYTGTIYGSIMGKSEKVGDEETFKQANQYLNENYDLSMLDTFGFNNTYTFAVTQEIADQYQLKTYSDLARHSPEIILGSTIEFMNRPDGYEGVVKEYDIHFKDVKTIDDSPRYVALTNNDVQVVDAYSTDALIKKYDLVVLEDDLEFFPRYLSVPIISNSLKESDPNLVSSIGRLFDSITDEEMITMNYLVDEKGLDTKSVARDFLQEKGILDQ